MARLVVRKAERPNQQDAPPLTPSQEQAAQVAAGQIQQAANVLDASVPAAVAAGGGSAASGSSASVVANQVLQQLAWTAYQEALNKVEIPFAQQVAEFAKLPDNLPESVQATMNFSLVNSKAVIAAKEQAASLVVNITQEQRALIADLVTNAVAGQFDVDELARKIRQNIGLHPKWAKAVDNRYNKLLEDLAKQGLPEDVVKAKAHALAMQYRDSLIRKRSIAIARTEVIRAENTGKWASWQSAYEQGLIGAGSKKRWIVRPIGACEICIEYAGQEVAYDAPFGNGELMPPAHTNCRCTAILIPNREAPLEVPNSLAPVEPTVAPVLNDGFKDGVFVGVPNGKIPAHAPKGAIAVDNASMVSPGDLWYSTGQKTGGFEVVGPGTKEGYIKFKTPKGYEQASPANLVAQGKAAAIYPGPSKIAKVEFKGDPKVIGASHAPSNAVPISRITQANAGDTIWVESKLKQKYGPYTVTGSGKGTLELMDSSGASFTHAFDKKFDDGFRYSIVPGPDKAKAALGVPGEHVKFPDTPTKTAAGDALRVWTPKPGDLTALATDKSTYTIQAIKGKAVTLSDETVVHIDDLVGLPTGSKVIGPDGTVHAVKSVKAGMIEVEDGTKFPTVSAKPADVSFDIGTKPVIPEVTPKPPAIGENTAYIDPHVVLGKQTAGPAGSNTAKPGGFWTGTDGVKRYVKAYDNPEQAYSEMLANRIYNRLGIKTPNTYLTVYVNEQGKRQVLLVTDIIKNEGTIGKLGLKADDASEIVKGFSADAWLANYDAVGTGLDNVVRLYDGSIARIDSGGSLFYRAQGGLKTKAQLETVDLQAFYDHNDYYRQVFKKLGIDTPADTLQVKEGIKAINKMVDEAGGVANLVDNTLKELLEQSGPEKDFLANLVASKHDYAELLDTRLKAINKFLPEPKAPIAPAVKPFEKPAFDDVKLGDTFTFDDGKTWTVEAKTDTQIAVSAPNGDTTLISLGNWNNKKVTSYQVEGVSGNAKPAVPAGKPDFKDVKVGDKYEVDDVEAEVVSVSPDEISIKPVETDFTIELSPDDWADTKITPIGGMPIAPGDPGGFVSPKPYKQDLTDPSLPDSGKVAPKDIAAGDTYTTLDGKVYTVGSTDTNFIYLTDGSNIPKFKWNEVPVKEYKTGASITAEEAGPRVVPLKAEQLPTFDQLKVGDTITNYDGAKLILDGKDATGNFTAKHLGTDGVITPTSLAKKGYEDAIADGQYKAFAEVVPSPKFDVTSADIDPRVGQVWHSEVSPFKVVGVSSDKVTVIDDLGQYKEIGINDWKASNFGAIDPAGTQPQSAFYFKDPNGNFKAGTITGVTDMPGVSFKVKWKGNGTANGVKQPVAKIEDSAGNIYVVPQDTLTGLAPGVPVKFKGEDVYVKWTTSSDKVGFSNGTASYSAYEPKYWGSQGIEPTGVVPSGWVPGKYGQALPTPNLGSYSSFSQQTGSIITLKDPAFAGNSYKVIGSKGYSGVIVQTQSGSQFAVSGSQINMAPIKGTQVAFKGKMFVVSDVDGYNYVKLEALDNSGAITFTGKEWTLKSTKGDLTPVSAVKGQGALAGAEQYVPDAGNWSTGLPKANQRFADLEWIDGTEVRRFDGNAGPQWGKQAYLPWRNSLTASEQKAISQYTGSTYTNINGGLRDGGSGAAVRSADQFRNPDSYRFAQEMMRALDRADAIDQPTVFTRGISVSGDTYQAYVGLQPGDLIYDAAFQSTSAAAVGAFDRNVLMRILVKPGQKGAYVGVNDLTGFVGEKEFIIQAGSTMRVVAIREVDGKVVVDLEIVEQNPGAGVPDPSKVSIFAKRLAGNVASWLSFLTGAKIGA